MPSIPQSLSLPAVYECLAEQCQLRFPVLSQLEVQKAVTCPRCGSPTRAVESYFREEPARKHCVHQPTPQPVEVLVDNLRSAYNVGSIFRTSDGAGIRHLHLCGVSPTPLQPSVLKTSLGAESTVPWSYHPNGEIMALAMRESSFTLWALETGQSASSIFEVTLPPRDSPVLLVIGNEVSGIDPAILRLCHQQVWIPMQGFKESLNVASAFSVAAYITCFRLRKTES